jgi:hypothetical protein
MLTAAVVTLLCAAAVAHEAHENCLTMYDDRKCQRHRGATTVRSIYLPVRRFSTLDSARVRNRC